MFVWYRPKPMLHQDSYLSENANCDANTIITRNRASYCTRNLPK